MNGYQGVVEILIKNNASIHEKNDDGKNKNKNNIINYSILLFDI